MNVTGQAAVHFYDSTHAAVHLNVQGDPNHDERFVELLMFALFALRQMVNIGGVPARFLAHMLAQTGEGVDEYVDSYGWGRVELTDRRSQVAKAFSMRLLAKVDEAAIELESSGFGMLGKHLAYYVPHSVMLMLLRLVHNRSDDEEYLVQLGAVADACGALHTLGKVNVGNQAAIGLAVVRDICLDGKKLFDRQQLFDITRRHEPPDRELRPMLTMWERVAAR